LPSKRGIAALSALVVEPLELRGDCSVEIEGVTKRFGDFVAVDDVTLRIRRGEFFSLLGPSGCGKTTLLRMIGGFELPTIGAIRVNGTDMTTVPVHKRPINMVFQHYALFPHLTVAENIAFGFRYKGLPRAEYERRIAEAVGLVRLAGFEGRYPAQLSGGQRQRVALARALALSPEVLLLDEPLGALDQKLRKEVQVELKQLQKKLGITFVFVTHDQEEALTMSDRIAVMNAGRVEQMDSSAQVFEYPRTDFVAQFMGASNFFTAVVEGMAEGVLSLSMLDGDRFQVRAPDGFRPAGGRVRFVVRPEKLDLRSKDLSSRGVPSLKVTIEDRVYRGVSTIWVVVSDEGEHFVIYEQNEKPFEERGKFAVGGTAYVCWNPRHTVLLEGEAGAPQQGRAEAAAARHPAGGD
jgi:spermidine/putrescine transport system ATP-binding protein